MGDFSAKAGLRFAMLKEGIPLDDLEPKSPIEVLDSSSKSLAGLIMYEHGISVQDLKKGTIYVDRERNVEEKKMKSDDLDNIEKKKDVKIYGDGEKRPRSKTRP